jgi:uncharacterized protein YggE
MNSKLVAILAVALLLALALGAWTQDAPAASQAPRTVTVTGEAEVRVVPDEVVLTLGVETWDKNLGRAKEQNDRIVAAVLALAGDHGVPAEHVQTDYVSIDPRYKNGYYEERDFIGYFVRKNVVVTLRDLSAFEPLLSDALEAGVNYVHGVEFRTTELRQHRDEARALAIEAAREKAVALAGVLDQDVGRPLAIQEQLQRLVGQQLGRGHDPERHPGDGRRLLPGRQHRRPGSDQRQRPRQRHLRAGGLGP